MISRARGNPFRMRWREKEKRENEKEQTEKYINSMVDSPEFTILGPVRCRLQR